MQPEVVRLVEVYRRIGNERMAELPIFNDRLEVEAVGFQEWKGHLLGVLIAPWFMNLVLLPGDQNDWSEFNPGTSTNWVLPSGTYEFTVCPSDETGPHQSSPLFTTVVDFPSQNIARAIAQTVMDEIFSKDMEQKAEYDDNSTRVIYEPVSRRDLLRKFVSDGK